MPKTGTLAIVLVVICALITVRALLQWFVDGVLDPTTPDEGALMGDLLDRTVGLVGLRLGRRLGWRLM